ncbi:MJ0042-type zinc finger domain-containing protein [Ruminococcus sp.]|uniref:MJ0042-type zinc finger domain-containing protein n=1 Tax=Ruminococcus sp. TaxID=41978 RepID=UPI003864F9E6
MFRLPVCPHCGTVYRYKDTKQAIRNKENTCYHCQKRFRAKMFPYILVGAILPLALCIGLNIFLLTRMTDLQLLPLFGVTLGFMLIIYLIIPFFTKFKKIEDGSKEQSNKKKG